MSRIHLAVESDDPVLTARLVAEALIEMDDSESVAEIAADFIENEVGRLDWINNWSVVREREDPVAMVQLYLDDFDIVADPVKIVEYIDRLARVNPGKWK